MLLPQHLAGLEVTFIEYLQNRYYESCRVMRSYRALGAGTLKRTFFPPLIGSGIPWSPKPAVAAASASVVGVPKKGDLNMFRYYMVESGFGGVLSYRWGAALKSSFARLLILHG